MQGTRHDSCPVDQGLEGDGRQQVCGGIGSGGGDDGGKADLASGYLSILISSYGTLPSKSMP